jgi:molecular chaperone IbpA
MRNYDFSPLFRQVVGFDHLNQMLESALNHEDSGYPPYNIEKTGENSYRITMAVAGFTRSDLDVVAKENTLTIMGKQAASANAEDKARTYLHRGIATRAFERRFQLAEHVKVSGASLAHGLLAVDLVREVPEEAKPRSIAIVDAEAN